MKLLTVGNAKTKRGESLGVLTGILHLNPATTNKLCPYASTECKALCLVNSGRSEILPMINEARTRKTLSFLENKQAFVNQLKKDFRALIKRAKKLGLKPAVRLNGTSDILWERFIDFAEFPEIQFYDYTKIPVRFRKLAPNYHLTFSFSGRNWEECEKALNAGFNVAIVFDALPTRYKQYPVLDGTDHDVRFLDAHQGAIVGLIPKGKRAKTAAKEGSAFIVSTKHDYSTSDHCLNCGAEEHESAAYYHPCTKEFN
jgi:hypothetical protein